MAVPEEIRIVPRPEGTRVFAYAGRKDKYEVKQVLGSRRVPGKKYPQPVYGPVIGHIINGMYVAKNAVPTMSLENIDLKDWGNVVFCDTVNKDILADLMKVFGPKESFTLYTAAILRACRPGITDGCLRKGYYETFLSEMYTDVSLSGDSFTDLLQLLGTHNQRIKAFLTLRNDRIGPTNHRIIDSTLKKNRSRINSLSEFSHKKNSDYPMISIMYSYDLERMEPTCYKVYPGNMVDSRAFSDFIKDNDLTEGMIIGDRGFPFGSAEEVIAQNPDLHYMLPLKSDNSLIGRYGMYDFDEVVGNYEGVVGKKLFIGDRWLYSFRDINRARNEELTYQKNKADFNAFDYGRDREGFGVIVFQSDVDMTLNDAYKAYSERWLIELMFRMYKITEMFDSTREHYDSTVEGSEFINFLATIMTSRMFAVFENKGLLKGMTYGNIQKCLAKAKMEKKNDGGWTLRRMVKKEAEILSQLVVYKPVTVKNPVGRPAKKKS